MITVALEYLVSYYTWVIAPAV